MLQSIAVDGNWSTASSITSSHCAYAPISFQHNVTRLTSRTVGVSRKIIRLSECHHQFLIETYASSIEITWIAIGGIQFCQDNGSTSHDCLQCWNFISRAIYRYFLFSCVWRFVVLHTELIHDIFNTKKCCPLNNSTQQPIVKKDEILGLSYVSSREKVDPSAHASVFSLFHSFLKPSTKGELLLVR